MVSKCSSPKLFLLSNTNSDLVRLFEAKKTEVSNSIFLRYQNPKRTNNLRYYFFALFLKLKFYCSIAQEILYYKANLIIIYENADPVYLLIAFFGLSCGVKNIFTIHDQYPHPGPKFLVIYMYNLIVSFLAKKIIIFSNPKSIFTRCYRKLIRFNLGGYESHYPSCTYNATILASEIDKYKPFVLFFGRGDKYKGLSNLPSVQKAILEICPELSIVIAGKNVTNYFNPNDLDKKTSFIIDKYLDLDEMNYLILNCEFGGILYNSITQSGVFHEFALRGKRIISLNLPEVGNFLPNSNVVNTVPVNDWNAFAHRAKLILNDKDYSTSIKTAYNQIYGLKNYVAQYSTI